MKLSEYCEKNIEHLASTIESFVKSRPNQKIHLNHYFSQYCDDLKKMRHCELDKNFVDDLSKVGCATKDDLVRLVDARPLNGSDYILSEIESALQNRGRGWGDSLIINRIFEILKTKPANAPDLMNRTLIACREKLSSLEGYISIASDPQNENPRQTIYMYGLRM